MPIGRVGAAALRIEQSLETISTRILARGHAPAEKSQRKAFTKPRSKGKLCVQRRTERSGSHLIRTRFLPRRPTSVHCAGVGELVTGHTHEGPMITRPAGLSTGGFADCCGIGPRSLRRAGRGGQPGRQVAVVRQRPARAQAPRGGRAASGCTSRAESEGSKARSYAARRCAGEGEVGPTREPRPASCSIMSIRGFIKLLRRRGRPWPNQVAAFSPRKGF